MGGRVIVEIIWFGVKGCSGCGDVLLVRVIGKGNYGERVLRFGEVKWCGGMWIGSGEMVEYFLSIWEVVGGCEWEGY